MPTKKKIISSDAEVEEKVMEKIEESENKEAIVEVNKKNIEVAKRNKVDLPGWIPKTIIGNKIKKGEITDIDKILDQGHKILEAEIAEVLIPDLQTDLLLIGQSKGKFGGGQRRVFRQTQKKTKEGNKPHFATLAIAGNSNGYIGIGYGKSKETVPAREKATRNAKTNIIKILRGCGSWQCGCKEPHTIPFKVQGKCGSVKITLIPAPKGTGLVIEKECAKILRLAGIKDIWSKKIGAPTKINLLHACFDALQKLITTKVNSDAISSLGIVEGKIKAIENE